MPLLVLAQMVGGQRGRERITGIGLNMDNVEVRGRMNTLSLVVGLQGALRDGVPRLRVPRPKCLSQSCPDKRSTSKSNRKQKKRSS